MMDSFNLYFKSLFLGEQLSDIMLQCTSCQIKRQGSKTSVLWIIKVVKFVYLYVNL